jgi:hypothetical protein
MNYFERLNAINVNENTKKKDKLTYLSWAWAWAEVKKLHPDAIYTIYENADGWLYHTDGKTCWVKTGVTIPTDKGDIEHIEYLPVMDFRNKSIPAESVTSYDVNKAIQRSLTKACARHGLGLYIYAGEDLPEEEAKYDEDRPVKPIPFEKKPAKVSVEPVLTPKERVESACNALRISLDTFGDLYTALQQDGKVPQKKTSELTPDEWKALMPLMQQAVKATKR